MIGALSVLMVLVACASAANPGEAIQDGFEAIGKGAQAAQEAGKHIVEGAEKEALAIKDPIDQTVFAGVFSQCKHVKKLFGVAYEQIEGEKEPDVDTLKIVYAKKDKREIYNISDAAEKLQAAHAFDSSEKLVVFVHGFTDDPTQNSFSEIYESFFKTDEGDRVTLLALDGSSLIHWLYLRSSTYVAFMGDKLGEIMATWVKNGATAEQIHMVGHSLGAHICGFAGKKFYSLTGKKVAHITGLDPAGPCFTDIEAAYRLNKTDADYVDAIHTDCGVYGINEDVGHADYYPNGGSQQPDCLFQTCSHSRAVPLYAESILEPHAFPARRCGSWQDFKEYKCSDEISYMGYAWKPGTEGRFYLQTASHSPFGLGSGGANYTNNLGFVRNAQDAFSNLWSG